MSITLNSQPPSGSDCLVTRLLAVPGNPEEWRLLDQCLAEAGAAEKAISAADEVLATYPQRSAAWTMKGLGLLRSRQFDAAIECLTKAIELGAKSQTFAFRGSAHAQRENWAAAEADFKRLLVDEPQDLPALPGLMAIKLTTGQMEEWHKFAEFVYTRHGESHYNGPSIPSNAAKALLMTTYQSQPLSSLMLSAVQKHINDVEYRRVWGAVLFRLERFEQASGEILKIPDDALAAWELLFLAMAQHKSSNAAAKATLDRAVKLIEQAEAKHDWKDWRERLEVLHLRKEAEALGMATSTTAPS